MNGTEFAGHVLPGSFFLLFGIWWTIRITLRYYNCKVKGQPFISTLTFPVETRRWGKWQIEGYCKVLFCTIGLLLGELITGIENGAIVHTENMQHATMFSFFGISGVVDILLHYKVPLPKNSDYVSALLANFVQGMLFAFHTHGKDDLDIQTHTLLVYTIFIGCFILIAEMAKPRSVLIAYARAFGILLLGTWFVQIAFMEYNPLPNHEPWDGSDHYQVTLSTIVFAWHMIGIFVFMIATNVACGCLYRRRFPDYKDQVKVTRSGSPGQGHQVKVTRSRSGKGADFRSLLPADDSDEEEY